MQEARMRIDPNKIGSYNHTKGNNHNTDARGNYNLGSPLTSKVFDNKELGNRL